MDVKKTETQQFSNSVIQNSKQGKFPYNSNLPVCPAGHLVLGVPAQVIILKLLQLQRYEAFCGHCQRRYIVYRWRFNTHREGTENWRIWRYRTFPGVDDYRIVERPPVDIQIACDLQEIAWQMIL